MSAYLDLARLHAPLLIVIAPFVAASIAFACPWPRLSWVTAMVGALLTATLAFDLAARLLLGDGAWIFPAEGVGLKIDGVGVFASALIVVAAVFGLAAAGARLNDFDKRAVSAAMTLALCMPAGWLGALAAGDLLGVFVAVEVAWLASVGLLSLGAERASLSGALRMLGAGGVGAAVFLCGAGLLYRSVGSIQLDAIASANIMTPDAAALGAGLMLVGVALKAGVAPLHEWMGAAFSRASPIAGIVLGAVGVVGALAVIVRLAAYIIPAPTIGEGVSIALAALGGASVIVGSLQAVGATNLRRLAAYAGAAQAGCILLCVALGSPAGFAAALVQLTAFAAAALALFGGAAAGGVV
ncbi:MAG: hypothetical protein H7124_04965, partial [Phycisphaerales bacterium]|nr:hypothetical protein [Hyphomonadaceae bacterium]